MNQYHVLVSCPLIQDDIDRFESRFKEHQITYDVPDIGQQLDEEELLPIIDQYDGILAGDDELSRRVIEKAENLKVISKWGIGIDNIDVTAAEERGIEVSNTPGAFRNEVADVVMGYAVMLTRHLHKIDEAVRNGEWVCPRGTSLAGKTFGVIGVGDIGSTVARRAAAFNMDVLGNDICPLPKALKRETDIKRVDREELLSRADIVSLNCALTEETREMIDIDELRRLGSEGYLINTARGKLINQDALIDALENDIIAGAALDVFAEEPLPADSRLTSMDNVILGSHNAQNTTEAVNEVHERAVENLIAGLVE